MKLEPSQHFEMLRYFKNITFRSYLNTHLNGFEVTGLYVTFKDIVGNFVYVLPNLGNWPEWHYYIFF